MWSSTESLHVIESANCQHQVTRTGTAALKIRCCFIHLEKVKSFFCVKESCVSSSGPRQPAQLHPVPQQPAGGDQRDDAVHAVQPVSRAAFTVPGTKSSHRRVTRSGDTVRP